MRRLPFILLIFIFLCNLNLHAGIKYARQSGDWDQTSRWSTVSVGGASCNCVPAVGDTVIIDGYKIDVDAGTGNVTVKRVVVTNASNNGESKLTVTGNVTMIITNNLVVNGDNVGQKTKLTVDDAQLEVQGDVIITRASDNNTNKDLKIDIKGTSTVDVDGDWTYNYLNANGEGADEMVVQNTAVLTVNGDMNLSTAGTGDDFIFKLKNSGGVDVVGDLNITHDGSDIFEIDWNATDNLFKAGNAVLHQKGGNDNLLLDINNGRFEVRGDLTLDNDLSTEVLEIELDNASVLLVGGDIVPTAIAVSTNEIDLNGTARLEIGGDYERAASPSNYGLISSEATTTIEFNGSSQQLFPEDAGAGTDGVTFQNVEVNNTGTVIPQLNLENNEGGGATILLDIDFQDGVLRLGSEDLNIDAAASITGGSAISFIDATLGNGGSLVINYASGTTSAAAFTFPLGGASTYAPISFTLNSSNSGVKSIQLNSTGSRHSQISKWNQHIARYWTIASTGFTSIDYDMTGFYSSGDVEGVQNGMITKRWDGGAMNDHGAVDSTANTISVAGLTGLPGSGNDFTAGGTTPLPIDLLLFTGHQEQNNIVLNWTTGVELNSSHFEIQRSHNGSIFESLGKLSAAGNSSGTLNYIFVDHEPAAKLLHYRLKLVDIDGAYEYSDKIVINFGNTNISELSFYPNPVTGEYINISYKSGSTLDSEADFKLLNLQGKILFNRNIEIQNGQFFGSISLPENISNGIYLALFSSGNQRHSRRLIIQ